MKHAWLLVFALGYAALGSDDVKTASITLEETVEFRTIESALLSPDGRTVAAIIRSPRLELNRNRHALLAVDVATGATTVLLEAAMLENPAWSSGSDRLYVLRRDETATALMQVARDGAFAPQTLLERDRINRFAVAESTGRIVYCATAAPDETAERRAREQGFVYELGRHTVRNITNRDYVEPDWEEIFLLEPEGKVPELIHRLPYDGPSRHLPFVTGLSLSPDGRQLAIQLTRRGKPSAGGDAFARDIAVLDLQARSLIEPLRGSVQRQSAPVWAPDSRRLYFFADHELASLDIGSQRLTRHGVGVPEGSYPAESRFSPDGRFLNVVGRTGHFRWTVQGAIFERIAGPEFAAATFDAGLGNYAFVDEASGKKPEIAVGQVGNPAVRRLTDLNPQLDVRRLGAVETRTFRNAVGATVTAYLVRPPGFESGRRYPLVVATYGFRGKFVLQGEWHSTFPAQVLASQGYLVLLLNRPMPLGQGIVGDPAKARDIEGRQMLSTIEAAVDGLINEGLADPGRLAIYGWSHGAFIVEYVLTHSRRYFGAAALGEGGDYKPGGYWKFGDTVWPEIYENMFGGPLSTQTAKAYLEFSPGLRFEHVDTPLLLEFAGGSISGLETFVPLRRQHVPAELVLYDGELHNFVKPQARLASMRRKIDWFNYWLLGQEDPDQAKAEQYSRWRKMKAEWEAKKAKKPETRQAEPKD